MAIRKTLKPYAGYRQFYLYDVDNPGDTGCEGFWTKEAFESRLPVQPGIVGISTDTYGEVPVTLEIVESEPKVSLEALDHVAEVSLFVSRGRISILGCPDIPTDVVIAVAPGRYRVRVYFAGLQECPDELEYNGDSYLIQLWPSEVEDRVILKRFGNSNTTI